MITEGWRRQNKDESGRTAVQSVMAVTETAKKYTYDLLQNYKTWGSRNIGGWSNEIN
jgi:hypothetical protein